MLHPDPAFVRHANSAISQRLCAAFDHLLVEVLGQAAPPRWSTAPAAHAVQDMMRLAALAGDLDAIRALATRHAEALAAPVPTSGLRVLSWGEDMSASECELLQHAFSDDIGLTGSLRAVEPALATRIREDILRLVTDLETAAPLWAEEFTSLISTVLLAESGDDGFAGASAFPGWGAILINPQRQGDDLALLMTLIHESSHQKLFIAYLDDEVVLNDPDERYSSPLRHEGRPMNGLFHAAYVLARMVCLLADLRRSGKTALTGASDSRLAEMSANLTRQFNAAHGVIDAHGQLTARGRFIIDEAAAAVAAA